MFRDDDLEANQPFGLGPWTCIGRNIAWMELRLIVAKLLWHFDWEGVYKGVELSGIFGSLSGSDVDEG